MICQFCWAPCRPAQDLLEIWSVGLTWQCFPTFFDLRHTWWVKIQFDGTPGSIFLSKSNNLSTPIAFQSITKVQRHPGWKPLSYKYPNANRALMGRATLQLNLGILVHKCLHRTGIFWALEVTVVNPQGPMLCPFYLGTCQWVLYLNNLRKLPVERPAAAALYINTLANCVDKFMLDKRNIQQIGKMLTFGLPAR